FSASVEEPHQIRDAAVIDVRVRRAQSPDLRIGVEVLLHVFVERLLQVDSDGTKRADHHVRTDAVALRQIAAGITELHVRGIVNRGDADLRLRSIGELPTGDSVGTRGGAEGDEEEDWRKPHAGVPGRIRTCDPQLRSYLLPMVYGYRAISRDITTPPETALAMRSCVHPW